MAFTGHLGSHEPHLIHSSELILYKNSLGFLAGMSVLTIAPTGQFLAQFPQPTHFSFSISYLANARQTLAGQYCFSTCAIYSSLKYFNVDNTGFGALCPNPHNAVSLIILESSYN